MTNKLIVIVGPNASGKSDLAVAIARAVGGQVVSADSRQVYKGMDIGSGKITKKEMKGVKHHLLDVARPRSTFTVTRYRNLALKAIKKIQRENQIPILCGGTGFYIQAVVDGIVIPEVKPDRALREKLEKMSAEKLYSILEKIDPRRAQTIEKQNPRRLIRAIEIVKTTKKPDSRNGKHPLAAEILFLGLKINPKKLRQLIARRTQKRIKAGMVIEVKRLRQNGLSWERLEKFGLEYRAIANFLQHRISRAEMIDTINKEDFRYAKRQMTWFIRDNRIVWTTPKSALTLAKKFVSNKKLLSRKINHPKAEPRGIISR